MFKSKTKKVKNVLSTFLYSLILLPSKEPIKDKLNFHLIQYYHCFIPIYKIRELAKLNYSDGVFHIVVPMLVLYALFQIVMKQSDNIVSSTSTYLLLNFKLHFWENSNHVMNDKKTKNVFIYIYRAYCRKVEIECFVKKRRFWRNIFFLIWIKCLKQFSNREDSTSSCLSGLSKCCFVKQPFYWSKAPFSWNNFMQVL